ncbi:MAG: HYR domain-containing protein [Draconibacterium sp.]
MTEPKNIGALKLTAILIAVTLMHVEAFSHQAPFWVNSTLSAVLVSSELKIVDQPNYEQVESQQNEELILECPQDISTYTDLNDCTADVSHGLSINIIRGRPKSLSWEMNGATVNSSPNSGINQLEHHVFNEGTTIITYTATDQQNNSKTCTFTVTVSDNQVPKIIEKPSDINVFASENDCGTIVNWKAPIITDNCATRDQMVVNCTQSSGNFFPVGKTQVTYTITDGNENNKVKYSFFITVIDKTAPLLTAPENISLQCGERILTPYATLQAFINAGGIASDNCLNPASFRMISEIRDNKACPYTIIRTYQVSDFSGNNSTVKQWIFVGAEEVEIESKNETQIVEQAEKVSLKSGMADFLPVTSGNWSDPATWGGTEVPGIDDNVTIPSGVIITVDASSAECADLFISSGGTLKYSGGYTLNVYGDWTNNGSYEGGTNGVVEFSGTNSATISGNTSFEELIISKGSLNTTLTINGVNAVTGGGSLTMNGGLLTIPGGNSFTVNPSQEVFIEETAGFDVTGGTLNTGNFKITNVGLIRISSGTANLGTASGNEVHTQVDGAFIVSGGNVNISGRLYNSASGTLNPPNVTSGISITGGNVILATVGNGLSNVGSLNVTAAGNFIFTGGTIVFQNPSSAATELDLGLISGGGTKNTVGGTFQFGNGSTSPGSVFNISSNILINRITSNANADLELSGDLLVNQLALNSASSVDLNGNSLQRAVSGTGPYTFPIDDGNGNKIPVTVTLISGTLGANPYIEVTTTNSKYLPHNESDNDYLNRYWTITTNGITSPVFDVTATYTNTDISGTETEIAAGGWSGGLPWEKYSIVNAGANTLAANNVSATTFILTGITSDPPTVSINNGNVNVEICYGTSTTLTTNVNGDSPISYSWSPAAGLSATNIANPVANPTSTTKYTVTVTDGNGFTANDDIEVIVHNLPTAAISGSATVCRDDSQPVITFAGSDGTAPYIFTYNIDGGATKTVTSSGNSATVSVPTNSSGSFVYSLISVEDANGCYQTQTGSATIQVNPLPTAVISGTDIVCKDATQPQITFTGAEGATPYIFTYTDGSGTKTVTSSGNSATIDVPTNSAGIFIYELIQVEDNNGCSQNQGGTATITVTDPILASATITDAINCFGGTANVQVSASGGTPPYTFNFDGKTPNSNGIFGGITGSVAGTVYNWSVTDANGCAAYNGNISVTEPEQLTANASITSAIICNAGTGTVTIAASGGTPPYSYKLKGINSSTGIFTNLVAGNNIAWSVTDANNCGPVTGTIDITQPTPIAITSATVTTPISCNGGTGSVTIVATGGTGTLHYTLNGQNSTNGIFNNVYAGTGLSYSVTDDNGCGPVFGTIDVNEPAAITASAAVTSAILCNGGTATVKITASGGSGSYSYTFNGIPNGTGEFSGISAGTNIPWSVTDGNGCAPVTGTYTVTQPTALTASVSETTPISCYGGAASIKINASGGTGTKTYSFEGQTDNTTGTFNGVAAGTYNWSVADASGCNVSGTYDVNQPTQIIVNSIGSNSAICNGSTLTLTSSASGGTGTLRYRWTGPNGYTVNNAQNPSILNATPAASGTYTLTVTDANNCTATATTDVTVYSTPTMNPVSDIEDCNGSTIPTISFSGADSYEWTNDDTSIGLGANGVGNIPSFVAVNGTDAPVTSTITVTPKGDGCIGNSQVFTITVNPIPEVEVSNSSPIICNNGSTNILLNSNVAGATFNWIASRVSGSTTGFTTGSGTSIVQHLSGAGVVEYLITPVANECTGSSVTVSVEIISTSFDLDVVTAGPNETTFCGGETYSLNFSSSPDPSGESGGGFFDTNHTQWETRFEWKINNPVVAGTTSGTFDSPGILNVPLLNSTDEDQTAVIAITPVLYYRSRTRNRWWQSWSSWSAWSSLCSGNAYTTTITVYPFRAQCPSDYEVNNDTGDCTSTFVADAPTFECSPLNLNWSTPDGSSGLGNIGSYAFDAGVTTVTYDAEDALGNTSTCSFNVTVKDVEAPVISNCPSDFNNVPMDAGECGATITWTTPTANDNCDGSVTLVRTDGTGLNSGEIFPVGTTTISYIATDAAGNSSTCSFDVTVQPDSEAPAITCVENQTECAVSGGIYAVNGTAWDATVVENCSGAVTKSYTLSGATSGTGTTLNNVEFNVGVTHVTWTATDINANSSSCSFDVTINEEPSFTSNPVTQTVCLNGTLSLTVSAIGEPAPTLQWRKDGLNISGENGTTLTIDPVQAGDAGVYDVVATNSCTSATSVPATITITNPPVITQQPANQTDCIGESVEFTVSANGGQLPYSYAWEMRPTASDAWAAVGTDNPTLLIADIGTGSNINGAEYKVTVTDNCGNSAESAVAKLTVNRIEVQPLATTTICQGGNATFTVLTSGSSPVSYQWQQNGSPISDGGAFSGTTTPTITITNGQVSENGTYSVRVTFNISQPNNNGAGVTTCQTSSVDIGELIIDEGPDIDANIDDQTICPGSAITDIILSNLNGTSSTTYTWTRDNTTVLTGIPASGTGSTINGILNSAAPGSLQTTVFTITATANGCVSTGQVTVSVVDDQAPTSATCPTDIPVNAQAGICGAVVNYTVPTFDDNCDGTGLAGTLVSGLAPGETFPVGTTTVVYEYTDIAGNGTATCSFDVTVTDNIDPVAACKDITVQLDATGNVTITTADIDNGSTDNCGTPVLSVDVTTFDCTDLGTNTVVLTATDAVGNTGTCSATVTVKDDNFPVNIAASVLQQDTLCQDDATTIDISATGGVGTIEYTFNSVTNTTGQFSVPAGYSYAWSVSNSLGCGTTSGTFYVEIRPDAGTPVFTAGPTILCQDAANEIYTATATNSNSISYSVSPSGAGTINSVTGEMNWDAAFSGTATITATATGYCNTTTESLVVDVTPTVGTPTAISVSAGTEPTCQLTGGTTTTTYSTTATNNTGFNWSISNAAAGSIDPTSGVMTWSDGFFGTVDIQVTANGCNGPSAQVIRTVNITPTVGTPSVPASSDLTICQGSGTSDFTTLATDATSYNWTVTGTGNTISGTGTTGTVIWDPAFSGTATVSVTANGCNGPSTVASTTVTVLPTPTATISGDNSVCQNSALEPEVVFTNPQSLPVRLTYNINGGSNQTIDIAANSSETESVSTTTVGDFVYNLVSVEYQSTPGCTNSLSGSVTVTIRPEAPVAPGVITGNDYVLPAASETYTISAVPNATDYFWEVPSGWVIVSGQGTTSITVTTGVAGNSGNISVTAKNDCGDSPATTLPVDVNPNLAIVMQPVSQSDCYGNSVLFIVSISGGAAPITYIWQRKTPSDATFSDITADSDITYPVAGSMLVSNIGSTSNPDGTQYQVRITDDAGSDLTSDPATLTVNQVLTMSPVDVTTTICEGENAGFSATTGGETPISMVWEKDGIPVADDAVLSGSATTSITFTNARPSDAGEYRLTVTFPMTQPNNDPGNPDNCVLTSTLYRTLVVNPLPVLSGPSEVCVGQTIHWTPNSGGTWVSNDPATATIASDGTITGVSDGTVTFTFTETATGCSSTSAPVTVHPLPTGVISGNPEICEADSADFSVTLTGTAPWDITYTDGTTPVTISGISSSPYNVRVSPGATTTYTLTAVNDVYCDATSLTGNAVVTVHPLPTATLSGDATVCIGTAANLVVDLTGSQPWDITYTDGITPVTITGITTTPYSLAVTPGSTTTYMLTAVSDVHCSGTSFTGTATVTVDQLPTASAGGSETICSNGTATVIGATAENGTILWTHDGAGALTDATTLTPTYTANIADAGKTVTLTMTVTSDNTCSSASPATATYTVIVDPLPEATAGGNETICTDGSVTVSGASAANGTILWTHNGTGTLTDDQTLTPTYTAGSGDSESTVTLTMTVTSDNACSLQTAVAYFTIEVLPEAQVNQPDDQEICKGTSTAMISFGTVNTTGTTTYSWTNTEPAIGLAANGTGNLIAPFTGENSGTEPLIATIEVTPHLTTDGVTCDGPSKIFTITVNPQPVAVAPIGLTYCLGILSDPHVLNGTPSGVTFDISGGASIGFPNVNGVTEIPSFVPTAAGTASITIIPKYNDCTGLSVSFNVTVRPTPVITISGGATVCQNTAPPSIVFTNQMNLAVVATYSINGTNIQNVNVPSKSNVSVPVPTNLAGVYEYNLVSVQYLESNPPTCANTLITGTATIEVIALPVPTITGPTNICAETADNVYETEAGMNNYTWVVPSGGNVTAGGTSTDNTVTITWTTGGTHNISVRYSNANSCAAATATVFPVNVYSLPIPTITGSTSACLNASKVYSTQPGMTNYQWNVSAGGTISAGGGINDNSVTITWDAVGAQTVSVNYTSADGCEASSETVKNITINPRPEPIITGADTVCAGTNGNVYTTEPGMSTYVWTVSAGGTITAGGTSNSNTATIRWNTDGPQEVTVSYINPVTGCDPEIATVFDVFVFPKPVPTIAGATSVCVGSTGNVYTTESGMTNYQWIVSAGGTITAGGGTGDDFVSVDWNTTGAKTVKVNYENANGCSATSATTKNITVNALPTPLIVGTASVCLGSAVTYSTVSGMSNYQWNISSGGSIVSGGGVSDHQVTVTWNNTGTESVSLNYNNTNGCSAAVPTNYAVTVNDLPSPTISGPADACKGGTPAVYTTEPGMTAYVWSVTGGTITAGGSANDNTATVVWNTAGAQSVRVNYYDSNNCSALVPFEYPVNVVNPAPPSCPSNLVDVCNGDPAFVLSDGNPVGGVYSGTGVSLNGSDYWFDPAVAGAGVHTITYTMPNTCADMCSFAIDVTETPVASAPNTTICSGYPADIALNSSVPGTTFSWTSTVISGSVTGNTNCSGSCGTMITDTLTNAQVVSPGASGTNAIVEYVVTATKDGCSSNFSVQVQVRPQVYTFNLTWNSNFVEDFIEVCAGAEALSDNDIEILHPVTGNLVGTSSIPSSWNPTFLYGPSPAGPWTNAPGHNNYTSYYQWVVDFSVNNQLGYHYFVLRITDPVTGCIKYSNPAILNIVSALTVEAGDPEYLCGGSTITLSGAYVSGITSSTPTAQWSVYSMNPSYGSNGSFSSTSYNPHQVM